MEQHHSCCQHDSHEDRARARRSHRDARRREELIATRVVERNSPRSEKPAPPRAEPSDCVPNLFTKVIRKSVTLWPQDVDDADGSWVHAYLHRVEGDLSNANYWYRRAGRPECATSLAEEWEEVARALLARQ